MARATSAAVPADRQDANASQSASTRMILQYYSLAGSNGLRRRRDQPIVEDAKFHRGPMPITMRPNRRVGPACHPMEAQPYRLIRATGRNTRRDFVPT